MYTTKRGGHIQSAVEDTIGREKPSLRGNYGGCSEYNSAYLCGTI